jgi:glutaminyl-tRNA synthetase
MPTLVGARRRGYTPEGFRLLAERTGVSKSDAWIDMSVLEDAMRDDLNARAERRVAVLDPIRLVIDNYPAGRSETCSVPNHPQKPDLGRRELKFARELWIERDDFMEAPPKGYFRLAPGAEARLRYAYIVKCIGVEKDAAGNVTVVHCTYDPSTRSGTPGAEARKVKGNIHWLAVDEAVPAQVRLYDRLFRVPFPGDRNPWGERGEPAASAAAAVKVAGDDDEDTESAERNFLDDLNPASVQTIGAQVEPALASAPAEARYQFERAGYFVADRHDHAAGAPVYNRTVTLKDSWSAKA